MNLLNSQNLRDVFIILADFADLNTKNNVLFTSYIILPTSETALIHISTMCNFACVGNKFSLFSLTKCGKR